jgi:hypothetical protein
MKLCENELYLLVVGIGIIRIDNGMLNECVSLDSIISRNTRNTGRTGAYVYRFPVSTLYNLNNNRPSSAGIGI